MTSGDTAYENLQVTHRDGIVTVTLDSTTPYNSLNETMGLELLDFAVEVAEDESDAPLVRTRASTFHDVIVQLHQSEKPILVGVNGPAAGAGFSLALLGDVVLIRESAYVKFAYSNIGLTGDGGVTYYLPRLVGLRQAREILVRDDDIDADAAVEMGLATETVADEAFEQRLTELADRLASRPTRAIGATRRLFAESFDRSLEEQLAAETEAMAEMTHTEDWQRGHAAFESGDGSPTFVGR